MRYVSVRPTIAKAAFVAILFVFHLCRADAAVDKTIRIGLDVALNQSVLMAGKTQNVYLRVALTGFALADKNDRPPVNIAIVIDKSGSMGGEKIMKAREAAIMAINRLNAQDIISVVTYDSTVQVLIPATKVSDKQSLFQKIRNIQAGSSTALFSGVSKGAAEMRKFLSEDRVNRLILLSDGLANIGPQSPSALGQLGASLIKEGISVTTIGLGTGYNEDLMTKLAGMSDGSHYFAERASELAGVFESEFERALSVVAQEIQTEIRCARGIRPVRFLGREGEIHGQTARVFINQLFSERVKHIVLMVEIPATADGKKRKVAEVSVNYGNMKTHKTDRLSRALEATFSKSADLVNRNVNPEVSVDVVELIATEENIRAMQLRDQGKVAEAMKILGANAIYLYDNSAVFRSERLNYYADRNNDDIRNLRGDAEYAVQRKRMQMNQFGNISGMNQFGNPYVNPPATQFGNQSPFGAVNQPPEPKPKGK